MKFIAKQAAVTGFCLAAFTYLQPLLQQPCETLSPLWHYKMMMNGCFVALALAPAVYEWIKRDAARYAAEVVRPGAAQASTRRPATILPPKG